MRIHDMVDLPLVSVITPTRDRERFLQNILRCFLGQDWPNLEWLIYDTSPVPSALFSRQVDPRVKYLHEAADTSVGEKRNRLIEQARGAYIVHFDDDDYYAPSYITTLISASLERNADFVKLSAFYLWKEPEGAFAYWDLDKTVGAHFSWSMGKLRLRNLSHSDELMLTSGNLGYGFSYLYRKSAWGSEKFPDLNWNEDGLFATRLDSSKTIFAFPDLTGICIHLLHSKSSSRCFPQYLLPPFWVTRLMPHARDYLRDLMLLRPENYCPQNKKG